MSRNLIPALNMIKKWEGCHKKVGDKIHAYLDPVKIPTIGWGSVLHPNKTKVKLGDVIDQKTADDYLSFEVGEDIPHVESAIKVKINDNQFGALVSFTYNVGVGAFKSSTLLKKLNSGDFNGAADEFLRWNKAGGKVLSGLTNRRKDERALFLSQIGIIPDNEVAETLKTEKPLDVNWVTEIINSVVDALKEFFGGENKSTVIPDDAETGAPTKQTLSQGDGPRITKERVEEILRANKVDLSDFCMLAIRGYYLDTYGAKGENDRRVYDDAIIQYYGDGFYTFRANVDPNGVRKGFGFGSSKGMANLMEGIWPYQKGKHNGSVPHMAFIQAGKVTVLRDGNPNYKDTGWFGINIHRGGVNSTSSLGCQTIQPKDWDKFRDLAYGELDKRGQKVFKYILVDEKKLRENILKV